MDASAMECARAVLDAVPLMMRAIGTHMRTHGGVNLSIPQFRTLLFLRQHEGASISNLAEHLEIALPSVSKLIDGLVARGMVRRQPHATDRRRVTLALTTVGRHALQASHEAAQHYLSTVLTRLPSSERATVAQAMRALQSVFAPDREPQPAGTRAEVLT